jgi:tetratricopeptide (TPR) repeat protein
LLRCLAWDPDVRPASAAEFAAELRSLLSPTRRLRRWVKRHEWALAVATVVTAMPAAYGVHVATMPTAADRFARTGEEYYREGRYEQAANAFTASLDADSQQPNVRFMRGQAYIKSGEVHSRDGRFDQAIKAFTAALDADRQQPEVLVQLGQAYIKSGEEHYREGRYDQAIKAFTASLAADSDQTEVLVMRGRAYMKLGEEHYREGRYDQAIEAFTLSLDADAKQPEVLFKRGRAHMKAGNYKKALEDLRETSLEDHPQALACCGYLYSRDPKHSRDPKPDHQAAIVHYEAAMDRGFVVNAYLLNDMAYSHQRLGHHQEAVDYATTALEMDAGLRPALYNRAIARLVLAEKKLVPDLTPGLDDIRQVLARGPLSAMDYWWAGKIAAKTIVSNSSVKAQLLPEAIGYFRKAIEKGCRQRLEVEVDVKAIAELLPAIAGAQPREVDQGPPPFQSRLVDPLQGTPD